LPEPIYNLNARWSFDIDGTLTNYPVEWLDYIKRNTGIKFNSTQDARDKLGAKYDELKNMYRLSEEKYTLPILDDAKRLIEQIYNTGGSIIISSSRPFDRYNFMKEKTANWLGHNGIRFEELISKSTIAHHNVDIHIDDELEQIYLLSQNKFTKFILINKKNSPIELKYHPNQIHIVRSIYDIKTQ